MYCGLGLAPQRKGETNLSVLLLTKSVVYWYNYYDDFYKSYSEYDFALLMRIEEVILIFVIGCN